MQCADLERYLEAYLDGRLGRTRAALLRRHLAHCAGCCQRISDLRQFERDLQLRFHTRQPAASLWNGLDIDLVRSAPGNVQEAMLPVQLVQAQQPQPTSMINGLGIASRLPVPPANRRFGSHRRGLVPRLMITLVALATLGTFAAGGTRLLRGSPSVGSASYRMLVEADEPLPFQSSDPVRLRQWLSTQSGLSVPPLPTPAGFDLAGARVSQENGQPRPVVVYRHTGKPALLTLTGSGNQQSANGAVKPASDPVVEREDGLTRMSWHSDGFTFELLSSAPPDELTSFTKPPPSAGKGSALATPL